MDGKPTRILAVLALGFLLACAGGVDDVPAEKPPQVAFFENLSAHCGKAFEGRMVFPEDEDDPLVGARLRMHLETCTPDELRIPFQVDEDRSRTWILTLQVEDLILKHDHRHEDGTPERITAYGGRASPGGTAFRQSFPADAYTRELIPEAATNVWTLEIDPERNEFIYHLERQGQPRYRAVFAMGGQAPNLR